MKSGCHLFHQLLSDPVLQQLLGVHLDHSNQSGLHEENALCEYRDVVGTSGNLEDGGRRGEGREGGREEGREGGREGGGRGRERGRERDGGREGDGGMEGGKEGGREWKRKPKMITGDLLQWFTLRHLVTVVKLGKLLHPVFLQSGGNLPHALGQDPNNVVQDLEHGLGDDLQYLRRNQTETGWDTRRNKMPRLGVLGFRSNGN